MDYKPFFSEYTKSLSNLMSQVDTNLINESVELIKNTNDNNKKIYIIGNGGSASIASHVSVDFAKVSRIPSSTFNNANLITCFANDYGYENWVKEAIKAYSMTGDLFILISSSGTSRNIVNAANFCKINNINLITLSGFDLNNPLSKLGNINFHVNSDNYNYVEMTHHIILVSIVDIFAKKLL
jgi:D-sedoheptulose 7-phosphate isomerase